MGTGLLFLLVPLLITGAAEAAVALANWVIRPLESLAHSRRKRRQFAMSDFLVLFAMLQFSVGTAHYLVIMVLASGSPSPDPMGAYILDALVAAFALLCWWGGASLVSRAGIELWWHRVLVLVFVIPVGILGSVVFAFLLLVAAAVAIGEDFPVAMHISGIACLLLLCVCACGLLTRWLAAKYRPSEAAAPPDAEQISQSVTPSPGD